MSLLNIFFKNMDKKHSSITYEADTQTTHYTKILGRPNLDLQL